MYLQQGDVTLLPCDIPAAAVKKVDLIVAKGEGHHEHVIMGQGASVMEDGENMYVHIPMGGHLVHRGVTGGAGEHAQQEILPGTYRVVRVLEWDPWKNEARRILD